VTIPRVKGIVAIAGMIFVSYLTEFNTYRVAFFFVLCTLYCQFLWIVHFWSPLRYSLTIIQLLSTSEIAESVEHSQNRSKMNNLKGGVYMYMVSAKKKIISVRIFDFQTRIIHAIEMPFMNLSRKRFKVCQWLAWGRCFSPGTSV